MPENSTVLCTFNKLHDFTAAIDSAVLCTLGSQTDPAMPITYNFFISL